MGSAYFIILDNKNPGFDTMVNGKYVSQHLTAINKLAKSNKLPDIDSFFSMDPAEAKSFASDNDVELSDSEIPSERFFDCDDGINWINTIRGLVLMAGIKQSANIVSDLDEYLDVLQKAKAINAKWHFGIDY